MTPNNSLNLGAPTGIYATWYTYTDVAGAQFRNLPTGWVQIQPAVVNSAPAPGPNGIIPTNYLITIPGQQWAQYYWNGAAWEPVNLQPIPGG